MRLNPVTLSSNQTYLEQTCGNVLEASAVQIFIFVLTFPFTFANE